MPSINKMVMLGALILSGMMVLGGCGSSTANSEAPPFNDVTGQHPEGWVPDGHVQPAEAGPAGCIECHGVDLSGGISGVSCLTCHVNGSPFVLPGCTSCHGNPPSGSTAPNRAGAHNSVDGHFAPQVTLPDGCNTCHNGAGTGTANHGNGVVVVDFLSVYSAKSGTAVYNNADGTCSNASCHGGQTTPPWLTGTIDVNTQCTSCHAYGTSQFNSFVSGQHGFHVNVLLIACVACHDTTKLAVNHFGALNTPQMEGPAAATINSNVNYNGTTCTPLCHGTDYWVQ